MVQMCAAVRLSVCPTLAFAAVVATTSQCGGNDSPSIDSVKHFGCQGSYEKALNMHLSVPFPREDFWNTLSRLPLRAVAVTTHTYLSNVLEKGLKSLQVCEKVFETSLQYSDCL